MSSSYAANVSSESDIECRWSEWTRVEMWWGGIFGETCGVAHDACNQRVVTGPLGLRGMIYQISRKVSFGLATIYSI